ncbi:hypothetical protein [Nocardia sp. NBC_00511]|uniref:hypothetical protein n=1 Tax=Nocardia sp. NBC_00511 TaxID=2903591 RepID=UPI0030E4D632
MTNPAVTIHRYPDGVRGIVPAGAPTVLDGDVGADTMVLEVVGGHLTWNVLAGQELPAAVIADVDLAQEWVWAIYGEPIALALDDDLAVEVPATPGLPALAVSARRLAYAHWASRWWPASTLDGIATLDPALLDRDIATLTEACEALVDGADAEPPVVRAEILGRASDYALAAGDEPESPGALVLARGTGGWDWRHCPPGLVDASEQAVAWQLIRDAGTTTVAVRVAAHPALPADLPAHLRPWARIETGGGSIESELHAYGDTWFAEAHLTTAPATVTVTIHLPGFGPEPAPDAGPGTELRRRVREFATARLRDSGNLSDPDRDAFSPLLAEIAAAAEDSDF